MKILHVIPPYYKDDEVLDSALSLIGRMLDSTEIHVAAFEEDMQKVLELNPNEMADVNGEYSAEGIEQKTRQAYSNLNPFGI